MDILRVPTVFRFMETHRLHTIEMAHRYSSKENALCDRTPINATHAAHHEHGEYVLRNEADVRVLDKQWRENAAVIGHNLRS